MEEEDGEVRKREDEEEEEEEGEVRKREEKEVR